MSLADRVREAVMPVLSIPFTRIRRVLCAAAALFCVVVANESLAAAGDHGVSSNALAQIRALQAEKAARTPAQQKLDSQLIYAARRSQNQPLAPGVTNLVIGAKIRPDGKCLVDIQATVSSSLLDAIKAAGGQVMNSSTRFREIRAWLPLDQLEVLAGRNDVRFIKSGDDYATSVGSLCTEGDVTHMADLARTNFGVDGTGVKVGVLSDSVDFLTDSQNTDDLPTNVVVLAGQSGFGNGEGTAMLEIIHDLAPGAELFFATATGGQAGFAQNILDLQAAGCDIILDDLFYFSESPFQDGIIAQAVNQVTSNGVWYFSAAGNEGNLTHDASGVWEGDFVDGGPADPPVDGKGGRIHSFGGTNCYDEVVERGLRLTLFWSDPMGASTNDYDLYVLDSSGSSVLSSSTTTQNGFQDPYEFVSPPFPGERIVVVQASGDARFLHLNTIRGKLALGTAGCIKGHTGATNAFSVAAVDANTSFTNAFVGGTNNPVETTSTDGPRRVFYHVDGSAITPGNYTNTGGFVRQKPDIAAADGVQTTVPGFNPFFGTSAATPHAAAIAALLKSYRTNLSAIELRAALTNTALDIEAGGVDRDSGAGIVMALAAFQYIAGVDLGVTLSASPNPVLIGNGLTYTICVTNQGNSPASGVTVTNVLPGNLTFALATTTQGSVTNSGNTVTALLGTLTNGTNATITIRAASSASCSVTNTVSVTGNETDPIATNNIATVVTQVITPVTAVLSDGTITNGQVQFTLTGHSNTTYVIQASTNLTDWTSLLTNATPTNGVLQFIDVDSPTFTQRFYRAVRVLE